MKISYNKVRTFNMLLTFFNAKNRKRLFCKERINMTNALNLEGNISIFTSAMGIFMVAGCWNIFKKCGIKPIWAIVPIAREYQLSLCADKEKDGRRYTIFSALVYIFNVILNVAQDYSTNLYLLLAIPALGVEVTRTIYMIRIYLGLCKIFNRRQRWIWLFLFFDGIVLFIWGVSPSFVPKQTVVNMAGVAGAKELGTDIEMIEEGLTVNIRERSVIDFFRKRVLLKDIHMRIPKGHMVLLLGGSGAGKTTYLNAVTGYEKADASITLNQTDIYHEYSKMMYDIGFVPQQDLMRGNDTVLRTLSDAATLRLPSKVSFFERKKRVGEVLNQFGLDSVKNNLVEKLSGGQRKRLSIAMEFISNPTLFILDEPDSGLDGVVARSLFEKLRSIADEGKIVVVITHTPDRVIDLFDDVIVLAKDASRTGRLAWYGPVNGAYEFFGKNSMEEILLSVNQKDEGGEGRADEFVAKYADRIKEKVG